VLRLFKYANENNLFRKSAAREAIYLARIFRVVNISCSRDISLRRNSARKNHNKLVTIDGY
jgi:tRNA uridine 5-carbamoylmethylation protein Kti12